MEETYNQVLEELTYDIPQLGTDYRPGELQEMVEDRDSEPEFLGKDEEFEDFYEVEPDYGSIGPK